MGGWKECAGYQEAKAATGDNRRECRLVDRENDAWWWLLGRVVLREKVEKDRESGEASFHRSCRLGDDCGSPTFPFGSIVTTSHLH